jgi:hypothetical protein
MQDVLPADTGQITQNQTRGGVITFEMLAYFVLIILSLLIRIAELDHIPLTDTEASHALAAWRAIRLDAPGDPHLTVSPLLFALQSASFGLIGASELSARIITAIGGVMLILTPLLFRDAIGRTRAFSLSILLAISPVLLASSRFSSPVVWSALAAVVMIWGIWRFSRSHQSRDGIIAIVCAAALVTLTEPGGVILLIIVAAAGVIASMFESQERGAFRFEEEDKASDSIGDKGSTFGALLTSLHALPWGMGVMIALLVVVVISTAFMAHLAGLSGIGELFAGTLRGFSIAYPDATAAFPLVITLFYEPFLWIFAVLGVIVLLQRHEFNFETRFLIAWIVLGSGASALFVGASPDHALWFILPVAALATHAVAALFGLEGERSPFQIPIWARGVVALAMLAIIAIFTLAFQDVARSLLNSTDGTLSNINVDATSLVLMLIPLIFTVITYFMVASLWNDRTALQGIGLGLLVFTIVSSLGSGWRIVVEAADKPAELWHTEAYSPNLFLLRETLLELGLRESGGFMEVGVTALVPPNSTLAWQLRDFQNAQFIADMQDAMTQPIVLLSASDDPEAQPDLGGSYVGQDFIVSREWSADTMLPTDFPALWSQRRVRVNETVTNRVVLWLRLDIYHGIELNETDGS